MCPGKTLLDPTDLRAQLASDMREARRVAQEAMLANSELEGKVARTQHDAQQLERRLEAVESKISQLPQLVAVELQGAIDRAIGSALRRYSAIVLGVVSVGGGGVYLRVNHSDDVNRERIEAAKDTEEATQKRLFQEALSEGMARRDRELEAARIAEMQRIASATRAMTTRTP